MNANQHFKYYMYITIEIFCPRKYNEIWEKREEKNLIKYHKRGEKFNFNFLIFIKKAKQEQQQQQKCKKWDQKRWDVLFPQQEKNLLSKK